MFVVKWNCFLLLIKEKHRELRKKINYVDANDLMAVETIFSICGWYLIGRHWKQQGAIQSDKGLESLSAWPNRWQSWVSCV